MVEHLLARRHARCSLDAAGQHPAASSATVHTDAQEPLTTAPTGAHKKTMSICRCLSISWLGVMHGARSTPPDSTSPSEFEFWWRSSSHVRLLFRSDGHMVFTH